MILIYYWNKLGCYKKLVVTVGKSSPPSTLGASHSSGVALYLALNEFQGLKKPSIYSSPKWFT